MLHAINRLNLYVSFFGARLDESAIGRFPIEIPSIDVDAEDKSRLNR